MHSPITTKYAVYLPTFGEIAGVGLSGLQWTGLPWENQPPLSLW